MKKILGSLVLGALMASSSFGITLNSSNSANHYAGDDAFSVRYKDFANTGTSGQYVGNGDLGNAANRNEAEVTWGDLNPFSISYDSVTGILTSIVGGSVVQKAFATGLIIDTVNLLTRDNDQAADIVLHGLTVNGVGLGSSAQVLQGTQYYTVTDLPPGDFSLSGSIEFTGLGFTSDDENSKLEIRAFGGQELSRVPDAGATAALLGLGLLGLAGMRKRLSK